MKNKFYKDKVAVITGGSSGIGLALAIAMVEMEAHVYIIARNEERLREAAETLRSINSSRRIEGLVADVSQERQVELVIDEIGKAETTIDFLINSAGIMTCGYFVDQSTEDLQHIMQVNYFGSVYTCRAAWPYLARAGGHIGFICSVAGYYGLIGYSGYAPTKFAMTGLAEALRMEGERDGISTSIIFPPDTQTPLWVYEQAHSIPESLALCSQIKPILPKAVAKQYLQAIASGSFEVYCDFQSRSLRWMKSLFPDLVNKRAMQVIKASKKANKASIINRSDL